jgi:uncharacterized protein YuzE
MNIEYFTENETFYIDLADRPGNGTIELEDGILLDIDKNGRALGLDID